MLSASLSACTAYVHTINKTVYYFWEYVWNHYSQCCSFTTCTTCCFCYSTYQRPQETQKKNPSFSHFDHFGLFDEPIYPDSVTGTCSNEVLYDIIPPGSISSLKQFLHNIFSVYIRHTTSLHWKNLEFHAFSQCTQSLNAFTLKSAKLS